MSENKIDIALVFMVVTNHNERLENSMLALMELSIRIQNYSFKTMSYTDIRHGLMIHNNYIAVPCCAFVCKRRIKPRKKKKKKACVYCSFKVISFIGKQNVFERKLIPTFPLLKIILTMYAISFNSYSLYYIQAASFVIFSKYNFIICIIS